jgi:hypothetical protein
MTFDRTDNVMHMRLSWLGPFFWPGYGSTTVPAVSSVYLWTVESRHHGYPEGYFLYLAGETNNARRRFGPREHTESLRLGKWTILDIESMQRCERREIWHGSQWTGITPGPADHAKIEEGSRRMMADLRLFVAEMPDERRLRQRVEAAIMLGLYDTPAPLCDLPDRGMHLRPRRSDEAPITVTNVCSSQIYGLPETMSV